MMSIQFQLPLPERHAATALRDQIARHLMRHWPSAGSRLFTETQLVQRTGLSRSTIRRALSPLESEGWIERRQGCGTFVGPRLALAAPAVRPSESQVDSLRAVRLAVVTDRRHPRRPDDYSAGIFRGLDTFADTGQLSLEVIGLTPDGHDAFARRVERAQPDVMAVLAPHPAMVVVQGVARLRKIPLIGTGDSALDWGLPCVSYEDEAAAAEAVRHLVEAGHHRIALIQQETSRRFVMRRRRGFWAGVDAAGLARDQNLELWVPEWNAMESECPLDRVQLLRDFLARQKPTALLFSEAKLVSLLGPLVRQGECRVPQDLSIVSFDQTYEDYRVWLGDLRPTVVALPLEQVGRKLGELALHVIEGKAPQSTLREACQLVIGDSVQPPRSHHAASHP
jgi:DNA-binding LacI/PurR family transcriptional regulator/DNA-binding transcriptional regulator YhcF (GntR family)